MDEDQIYELLCSNCPRAKQCHEDCEHCDEYLEKLEEE